MICYEGEAYQAMLRTLANLVQPLVSGFLVVALVAPAIEIHHDHPIEPGHVDANAPQQGGDRTVGPQPLTYHEVHVVHLLSGDSFRSSGQANHGTHFTKSSTPFSFHNTRLPTAGI